MRGFAVSFLALARVALPGLSVEFRYILSLALRPHRQDQQFTTMPDANVSVGLCRSLALILVE